MSSLQKDHNPAKSFGDKKAKTLTDQIGLHRRWFDMPIGANLQPESWSNDYPLPSSTAPSSKLDSATNKPTTGRHIKAEQIANRLNAIAYQLTAEDWGAINKLIDGLEALHPKKRNKSPQK